MKYLVVLLALFALCAQINAQTTPVILCTYYDSACQSISECSIEITNTCTNLPPNSMFIQYNSNGTGVVSIYAASGCTGTSNNVSFTNNVCTNSTGGTSLQVITGAQIWTTLNLYANTPGSCAGNIVAQTVYTTNVTGFPCMPANCSTGPFSGYTRTCSTKAPVTTQCGAATTAYTYTAGFTAAGCPASSIFSYSCSLVGPCIPSLPIVGLTNASSLYACNNGLPSATVYIGPGCTGNISVPVNVNLTVGNCIPTGIAPGYTTTSCISGTSSTTGGATSTGGASTSASTSGSTSAGSLVSFSALIILSILAMIIISLLV